jgi:hypothetical protein
MNTKKLHVGSLAFGAGLALARKLFATTAPAGSVRDHVSYEAIDACIDHQTGLVLGALGGSPSAQPFVDRPSSARGAVKPHRHRS